MTSFAADAVVYACHSREGGNPWTLAFACHSGGFQQPDGWSSRVFNSRMASHPASRFTVIPAKAGIHFAFAVAVAVEKIKSVSSAPWPSSFLLVSVTARAGARANGEAGPEGVNAMDGANQRNEPKKNAFPGKAAPSHHSHWDFSTRHPWPGRKTAHILCAALRVFGSCRRFCIFRSETQSREIF